MNEMSLWRKAHFAANCACIGPQRDSRILIDGMFVISERAHETANLLAYSAMIAMRLAVSEPPSTAAAAMITGTTIASEF